MRILQVNKFFFRGGVSGGVGQYLFSLLPLLEARGHTVIPFAMRHSQTAPTPYERFFVSYRDFSRPRLSLPTAARALYSTEAARNITALVRETRPDVAHVHLVYHQLSPSVLVALHRLGVPIVLTVHDFKPFFPTAAPTALPGAPDNPLMYSPRRFIARRCVKNSALASAFAVFETWLHNVLGLYTRTVDRFIAPSVFVADQLVRFGVPSGRITHLPHFIRCSEVAAAGARQVHEEYYSYVGRLAPEKDLVTLLAAHHESKTPLTLRIVGSGPAAEQLRAFTVSRHIPGVVFLGEQDRQGVHTTMAGARCAVAASRFWETFGLTVLEAYCQKTPVLAARAGALPELVDEGATGLLYDVGDVAMLARHIRRLSDDAALAQKWGEAGYRFAQRPQFTPEAHITALESLYRAVQHTNTPRRPGK